MTNSLLISVTIYEKLSNSNVLKRYLDNKIYPLVAANSEEFPFIVFYRDDIKTISCKDGYHEDEVTFTIVIVSNKYIESLEIANEVRSIFEKKRIVGTDIIITDSQIDGVDETWEDNSYVQKLHFTCKIN